MQTETHLPLKLKMRRGHDRDAQETTHPAHPSYDDTAGRTLTQNYHEK